MKQVTIDSVRERIAHLTSSAGRVDAYRLSINEEFELACLRQLVAVMQPAQVAEKPDLHKVIYHFRDWNEGFPVERFKADYVISWMLANYPPAPIAPEVYNIGDATMRHIFTPTGMTNVSDMQAVFDRVETVLVELELKRQVLPPQYGHLHTAPYQAQEPATDNTAQQFEALATSNAHDCLWSYDSDQGTWHGKCGIYWVFMDDGPDENGMKFCPGCGKPVASTNAGSGKP